MSRKLEGVKPERVFYYFEEISKIPRCSYYEEKISNYLKNFGEENGFETIQDKALNIIIKKPGTVGYENSPSVVLQGHMDMVCEKEDGSDHDFSKDPLNLKVEGDFLKADKTTLGADNGIAVAMGLAVLESKDISHPPLELLITTNEESGMDGAFELDPKNVEGRILINIDSEKEGTALVSCAGGERNCVTLPIIWKENSKGNIGYLIKLSGLQGGHSGIEIDKERGNSNKILGRLLEATNDKCKLCYIEGGSKTNAIPSYGKMLVTFNESCEEEFLSVLRKVEKQVQEELKTSDPEFKIIVEKTDDKIEKVFSDESLDNLIEILKLIPTGVQTMSKDIEGLVESSNNLGIVRTLDEELTIESAIRSSETELIKKILKEITDGAEKVGAKWENYSSYPAWEYKENSKVREVFKTVYKEQYGKELNITAIHAGLECGLFKKKFGEIDMISFGPNMEGVHSPEEKLSISSTERTYNLLLNVLKAMK